MGIALSRRMNATANTNGSAKMSIEEAKGLMVAKGFTPSACSWEDEDMVFVFSKELATGRSLEGAAMTITHRKDSGSTFIQ